MLVKIFSLFYGSQKMKNVHLFLYEFDNVIEVILTVKQVIMFISYVFQNTLRKNLDILCELFQNKHKVLLPHNPGYEVSGIELNVSVDKLHAFEVQTINQPKHCFAVPHPPTYQ